MASSIAVQETAPAKGLYAIMSHVTGTTLPFVSMLHSSHGVTLGFGVTLIGEAVDYAIYLFGHMHPGAQSQRGLRRLCPTLRLGVLTSACGFGAMLFSGFPGLVQLGLFSVVGLVTAVLSKTL